MWKSPELGEFCRKKAARHGAAFLVVLTFRISRIGVISGSLGAGRMGGGDFAATSFHRKGRGEHAEWLGEDEWFGLNASADNRIGWITGPWPTFRY